MAMRTGAAGIDLERDFGRKVGFEKGKWYDIDL